METSISLLLVWSTKCNGKVFILLVLLAIQQFVSVSMDELRVGFYSGTCPDAEAIVRSVVRDANRAEPQTTARLLRLHFHDCFVEGCDGSILIEGEGVEKDSQGHQGLQGFDVIEKAKAEIERLCNGVVSCADIVALAARDSVALAGGPFYEVPTGRRDGTVSSISLAANLPEVDESIQSLKSKFREKGLTDKDLVLLSGAHTIGTTACFFMTRRLYNFTQGGGSDPSINSQFLKKLKETCPFDGDVNTRIALDPVTELKFDDQILHNIRNGLAVIASDARLLDDGDTRQVLESYVGWGTSSLRPSFMEDFAEAMVKMGTIEVKTGSEGEIRRICKAFN